jgi:hypothetical protein
METYSADGEVENGLIWMQMKATDSLGRSSKGKVLPLRLEWRDLLFWLNDTAPVVVILYDAQEDRAFWLHVQEYFRRQRWTQRAGPATTVTVHIPMANVLNEAAIRLFARLRDEYLRPA